jgi:hypothetical protein
MFARILEVTPKLEKKDELISTIRQEILPILKKQPSFLELLPFKPEIAQDPFFVVSLWTEKRDIERSIEQVFPEGGADLEAVPGGASHREDVSGRDQRLQTSGRCADRSLGDSQFRAGDSRAPALHS